MRHPGLRDRAPAVAYVDAGELEPPEKRRGVDPVESHVVGELRRDEPVVVGEHLGGPPLFDQIEGEMPAVVARHEMRGAPVRPRFLEKGDALLLAVRRLEHMGHCMHGPGVARIAGQRIAADIFRAAEFARLLEPEGVSPEDEARQRIVAIPGRQHARDRIAQRQRLAEKEIGVLPEAQRQRVGRPVGEDRLPGQRRLRSPARGPRPDRGEMEPFAGGGSRDRRLRRAKRGRDLGMVATKSADHEEARDRNAAECEAGIDGERLLESADRIAGKRVIVGDCAIESLCRRLRAGESQPLLVLGH